MKIIDWILKKIFFNGGNLITRRLFILKDRQLKNKNEIFKKETPFPVDYFNVEGAGMIAVSQIPYFRTGNTTGFSLSTSWIGNGLGCAGVLDIKEAKRMAEYILEKCNIAENKKQIDPDYKKAMQLYIDGLKIQEQQLSKEYQFLREDQGFIGRRLDLLAKEKAQVFKRIKAAKAEISGMNENHDQSSPAPEIKFDDTPKNLEFKKMLFEAEMDLLIEFFKMRAIACENVDSEFMKKFICFLPASEVENILLMVKEGSFVDWYKNRRDVAPNQYNSNNVLVSDGLSKLPERHDIPASEPIKS